VRLLLVAALLGLFFICSRASVPCQRFVAEERAQHAAPLQGLAAAEFIHEFQRQDASTAPKSTPEQPDIGRSGRDFLEVCSSLDSKGNKDSAHNYRNAPAWRDATCLGWVEGFADGLTVRDELLSVPRKDRMACVPQEVTTIQTVRVIKKYLADNPEKARRPTRYIASIALAGAFPCKAGE
jgi:hypothetical protein